MAVAWKNLKHLIPSISSHHEYSSEKGIEERAKSGRFYLQTCFDDMNVLGSWTINGAYTNSERNKWGKVGSRDEDGVKSAWGEGKKVFLQRVATHPQPRRVSCHRELHNILYYLYINTRCNSRNPVDVVLSIYPETHPTQITLRVRLLVAVAAHFSSLMM